MTHPVHTLLLAGATGLIGHEVLLQSLQSSDLQGLHALVRRPPDAATAGTDRRLAFHTVDFQRLPVLPAAEAAICALGTTIEVAGSQAAFRAVDHDAVLAFALAAHDAGVRRFGVVSALGADVGSRVFYNRVKGDVEAALRTVGFKVLVIARPSLLEGDRAARGQPDRRGERIGQRIGKVLGPLIPKAWRPIHADVVARALLRGLAESPPGVQVLTSGDLHILGAAGARRPT
jgi:uncharacterized protein YbjT (DUF2867 family)